MSAGYGSIWIKTFTKDGKPDSETATKVFDYAVKSIDWFCKEDGNDYGDYFSLKNNEISTCKDGLDIKYEAEEASESDWIEEIASNIKPAKMVVYILSDFRESYSDGSGAEIKIFVCNGEEVNCVKEQGFAFGSDFDFFLDSSYGYPFFQGNYKYLVGLYKSKKTGKVYKTTNYLEVHSDDDDYDSFIEAIMNGNYRLYFGGELCCDKNKDSAYSISEIKTFSDEPEIDDFEMSEEDENLEKNEDGEIDFSEFEFVEFVEEDADY